MANEPMPYFVYVLQSQADGGLYTGSTQNIEKRLREHNAGRTKSLRHRRPLCLLYTEEFQTRSEAMSRELYFKTPEGALEKRRLMAASARG
jgi:putative endonuclease